MASRNSIGAVIENESAHQSIPLLRSNEEQLAKIRRQLERMFRELRLVQDVIMVCGDVRESTGSDLNDEVEHVLRRCGSDRLFSVLKVLTEIVERFGGRTDMSEAPQELPRAGDPDLAADELQAGIERAENKRRELLDARPAERENARVLALMP